MNKAAITPEQLPPYCRRPQDLRFFSLRNIRGKIGQRRVLAWLRGKTMPTMENPDDFLVELEAIEQEIGTGGALLLSILIAAESDRSEIIESFSIFYAIVEQVKQYFDQEHVFMALGKGTKDVFQLNTDKHDLVEGLNNFHHNFICSKCII